MTTTLSAQQARNTKVFIINNYSMEIEETTLYDHVMESLDETTSPRGVMKKFFVEESSISCNEEGQPLWAVKKWFGSKPEELAIWDTEEEAQDDWYTRTYNYDFLPDDQRDTWYTENQEEAQAMLAERKKDLK